MNASTLIYLVAGEPSGDALGATLMRALKKKLPHVTFAGIGGKAMEAEGLVSLFPMRELSIMGFIEILPHIPALLKRIADTADDIASRQPAAVITIDSPGFTFRLAKKLLERSDTVSIRRIHYVAPSVWAYKPHRAAKTAKLFHALLTLLPFEPPYFEKEGLKTFFVGHPVLWQDWKGNAAAFRNKYHIPKDKKIVLILPGSRPSEVERQLPLFLKAVSKLKGYVPVILAGTLVKNCIKASAPQGMCIASFDDKIDAFAAASLALSKSGTITLELAAAGVPMVVAHKVNAVSAFLIRRMIKVAYASLVNIAVRKEVIPELLQEKCTPENIETALQNLTREELQNAQRMECRYAINLLKGNNVALPGELAADAVLATISTTSAKG